MNCMEHLLRTDLNRDWLTLMLIGILVLLGILRYWFPKRMSELLLLPINDKYFTLEGRQKGLSHPFNIAMLVVQIIAFGLLLSSLKFRTDTTHGPLNFTLFSKSLIIASTYLILRYLLDWGIGYIFNCQKLLSAYRYERLSFHHLISVLLLLLFATTYFARLPFEITTPIFLWLVLFALTTTIIYSIRRNSSTLITNFLYFILYICALEIAPYALLYQAAMA